MAAVRRWIAVAALAAGQLIGCSGDDTALPPTEPLCDGSDELRLVFTSIVGFGSFGSGFSGKYGSGYLVIDGHCDYWLGSETPRGLRTGRLDASTAAALAEELHFGRYSTVAGFRDPGGCTDAGLAVLDDGTATLRTTCWPRDAPRVFREAFSRTSRSYEELDRSGTPAWERTRLLAVRDPFELQPDYPGTPRVAQAWDAALDLEPRSVTGIELAQGLEPDAGVLVEDGPTLAVLAEVRRAFDDVVPYSLDMLVRDAEGRGYQLLVRDEPPERVRAALEAALVLPP
jgi:hypothetical protein